MSELNFSNSNLKKDIMRNKSFFEIYSTSYYILFILIISTLLLLADNDPPPFPPIPTSTPVDSFALSLLNFSQNGSYFTFFVNSAPFVQYPQSTALQLVRVVLNAPGMLQDIPFTNFNNISHFNNGYGFSFSIQSQILSYSLNIICYSQLHELGKIYVSLPEQVNSLEGFSSAFAFDYYTIQYNYACYLNETIIFSSQAPSKFEPVYVANNFSIPISTPVISANALLLSANTQASDAVIFISETPTMAFEQLLYVLFPLYGITFSNLHTANRKIILTQNQSWLIPNIQKLLYDPIFPQNENTCFSQGIFLRSPSAIPVGLIKPNVNYSKIEVFDDYLEWIISFKPEIMGYFREHFTKKTQIKKNKFVLDKNVKVFSKKIQHFLPEAEIVILDETTNDISIIADTLGDAEMFISAHISTFAFAVFLPENSTLLEFQPNGLECTRYGEKFAKMANAKYYSFFKNTLNECECSNISCFFRDKVLYNQISEKNLRKNIMNALKK